jgi:hypothetical protein
MSKQKEETPMFIFNGPVTAGTISPEALENGQFVFRGPVTAMCIGNNNKCGQNTQPNQRP